MLLTKTLDVAKGSDNSPPSSHLLQLIIGLALASCTDELKSARGKEMALALTQNVPSLVKACQTNEAGFSQHSSKLVVSLRTLASLVQQHVVITSGPPVITTEEEKEAKHTHHHHKDKTDPR